MRTVIATVVFLALVSPSAHAAIKRVQAFPSQVFAKEATPVMFTAEIDKTAPKPGSLSLYQVDASGKRLAFIGVLNDDRVSGDKIKGDGVYTRKFDLNGAKSGELRFVVVENEAEAVEGDLSHLPPVALTAINTADVQVDSRPTLPQVLRTIWQRVANRHSVSSTAREPEATTQQ